MLSLVFLCFALQVIAWVVLPLSDGLASEEEGAEIVGEAVAA